MVLLDHLWDDVVAGPQPERGLKHLKRLFTTTPLNVKDIGESSGKFQGSLSTPGTPVTPVTPGTPNGLSPDTAKRDNVWLSVFGSNIIDKPQPNSPTTVYDWMYIGETRSKRS